MEAMRLTLKENFGRSIFFNPCTNESQCKGDFDCDVDVDGTDAALFKLDFGRSGFNNPGPACIVGNNLAELSITKGRILSSAQKK